MNLPQFKYHPDPIATGSIKPSEERCECCGQCRGYNYVPAIYGINDLEHVCPWCIADGTAHEQYDAEFNDAAAIGGYAKPKALPRAVVEEVAYRTPGFCSWQQEQWLTCCGDAAAFVGCAGRKELERDWSDAIDSIRENSGIPAADWDDYYEALDKDGGPTAYVFRCLHCGRHLGYSDCH